MKANKSIYEAPKAITYTEDEIMEIVGPALTTGSSVGSGPHITTTTTVCGSVILHH